MNTEQLIYRFFNRHFNDFNEDLFLPNEYEPPKGFEGLKVKRTVQPKKKASFNEVYINTLNK